MTESRPPSRTPGGTVHPEQDTTALPRVQAESPKWDPPRLSGAGEGRDKPEGGGFASSLSARVASAAGALRSTPAATGTSARPDEVGPARGDDLSGGAQGPEPDRSAAARRARGSRASRSTNRQPRKARLTLSHINVYSAFKFSCVLAIALFLVWMIMVGVLYGILDVAGVFGQINKAVGRISGSNNPKDVVTGSIVFGGAILIGAAYMVLFVAMSTIGSMVYNLCADLVGGIELTLSERE